MSALPYVTAPGNISRALDAIQKASTPEKVTGDFVKTILKIPGGSGDQMTSFLKKIGFAGQDGTPTELYTRFRNRSTSGRAVAEAIKRAYAPLYKLNEYMHQVDDDELVGLVVQETGKAPDENAVGLICSAIGHLKKYADFSASKKPEEPAALAASTANSTKPDTVAVPSGIGLNLGYTINLNLPATTDIAVFNAIFKSLKENLLRDDDA